MKRLSAVALLSLALACGKNPIEPAPTRITALPRTLTTSEQRLIDADNRLAIKLLKQVTTETSDTLPNLFISPLSIAMALGMTYNGAAGTTADAMRTTLELDSMTLAEVNEANRNLVRPSISGRAAVPRRDAHLLRCARSIARFQGSERIANDQ
jgi:serpin B